MIIADTGPLIAFARIARVDLLRHVVGQISIPEAVYRELVVKGKGKPGAAEFENVAWIQRRGLRDPTALALLPTFLHPGETEAILLAEELRVPLLIDEHRGRKVALDRGIDVLGSLAILVQAKRRGFIDRAKPLLDALLSAAYWIDDELVPGFLSEVGEA